MLFEPIRSLLECEVTGCHLSKVKSMETKQKMEDGG